MHILPAFIRRRLSHRPYLTKIVDNIGWLFFEKILRLVVGLLVGVWVARYLGPEQFGLLSFALALVTMFGAVATLGLQGVVVRDLVREPVDSDVTLGTAVQLQLVGGLLAYGLLMAVIYQLRPDDVESRMIVAVMGVLLLFKASEIAGCWFEAQVKSKYTVWVQNVALLLFAGVRIVLILLNAPLIIFVWVIVIEAAVVAGGLAIMLTLHGPGFSFLKAQVLCAKKLLHDSWPLALSSMTVMIYIRIDQIMLGQMLGEEAVGIYSAAVRLSEVWLFIPIVLSKSLFPAILESKKVGGSFYAERMQKLYVLLIWSALAVVVLVSWLGQEIVLFLYGQDFMVAGTILSIHIVGHLFGAIGLASNNFYIVEGLQKHVLYRSIIGVTVNVTLNFILIKWYGLEGAAIATVISQLFTSLIYTLLVKRLRVLFWMSLSGFNPARVVSLFLICLNRRSLF